MSAERSHRHEVGNAPQPVALLVDRDDDTRAMYGEYLRASGYSIEEAADGREALARALAQPPAVVITEISLPGMSGIDLCHLLRRDHATRRVPIIVVTASGLEKERLQARAAGSAAVLPKPCLPDQLVSEIQRALSGADEPRAPEPPPPAAHTARALARRHARYETTVPPLVPPMLVCPACDLALRYVHSNVGGVNEKHREQWDTFTCPAGCGTFEFRHRTRRVQRVG
jgi:CheY-like chemotaxis protein